MQQPVTIKLRPSEAEDAAVINTMLANATGFTPEDITGYNIMKRSLDSRGGQSWIVLQLMVFINEPFQSDLLFQPQWKIVQPNSRRVIIIGAGPAGLFAALRCLEQGFKPIVLERGKDVRARRRDLAAINKEGVMNSESNYCFGEGGAGTYSDGKLYTRSTKRGDVKKILDLLVYFGAPEKIRFEAHPHIGTNKLPQIITAIREKILESGGEILFEKKLTDLIIRDNRIVAVKTADGDEISGEDFILATGHSARDIFLLLDQKKILIEAKPFALGVRIEHPQALIDSIQYRLPERTEFLPPASYSLVQQVEGNGVFSFCMCPGGIIAPAATAPGEIVVNGWSPSKRNNPYANSGIVVTVDPERLKRFEKHGALKSMYFQQEVEQKAHLQGGGDLKAPAQRMMDFVEGKISSTLPDCSYLPGISSADLKNTLPAFIHQSLQMGFREFGKKLRGYLTNEAVVVATESRTSSPVRIPRDREKGTHPQLENLFPCGEGAGFAGGIVSAAIDGERSASLINN